LQEKIKLLLELSLTSQTKMQAHHDSVGDQERKKSLERHSSSDVSEIPIVKLIESQVAQSENDSSKPIASFVSSLFKSSGTSSSSASTMNWISGSNTKKDPSRLNVSNLLYLKEPSDVLDALNRAAEQKNSDYSREVLDLVTHLCEQDGSKTMSSQLGTEGVCSVVEQLLGQNIASADVCEAALRAICSLVTPASLASASAAGANAGSSNNGNGNNSSNVNGVASGGDGLHSSAGNMSSSSNSSSSAMMSLFGGSGTGLTGSAGNRRRFSSAGAVYLVIKATTMHAEDEIVLEWGLRVLFYLTLEAGKLHWAPVHRICWHVSFFSS
jgi:hypothetical protein